MLLTLTKYKGLYIHTHIYVRGEWGGERDGAVFSLNAGAEMVQWLDRGEEGDGEKMLETMNCGFLVT